MGADSRGAARDSAFDPLGDDASEPNAGPGTSSRPSRCILPAPADLPFSVPSHRLGRPSGIWRYCNAAGALLGAAARFDLAAGGKEILPLTVWDEGTGPRWVWRAFPEPRPLYGLDRLAQHPDSPLLVCEGEKAADAAAGIFPDFVAITSPGGCKVAGKADWSPLAGRSVTIWPDQDVPGRAYAEKVSVLATEAGAALVRVVAVPTDWPVGWDLADRLPEQVTVVDLRDMLEEAKPMPMREGPLPLRRVAPAAEPFPIEALGAALRPAAEAIQDFTQAPMAICAQSVLAAAALAAQAHADVILPTGQRRPASCYFVTVAASGERKSACDDRALKPVRDYLSDLRFEHEDAVSEYRIKHDAWEVSRSQAMKAKKGDKDGLEADLRAAGPAPQPPLEPRILCAEPTIEGLFKLLRHGLGFAGIFSDEGGSFIGGHGLSPDNKLKTAAYLSNLWDGTAIDRTRQGDDLVMLYGRRLSLHLMVQPIVAERFLSDRDLLGQGLLSRVLVSAPESAAGSRLWRDPHSGSEMKLARYCDQIRAVLHRKRAHVEDRPNELTPKALALTAPARHLWIEFQNNVESQIGPDGALRPIAGLANKLPEHAARLAAVLTMIGNHDAEMIEAEEMAAGIALAQHYQNEALRLFAAGATDPDLALAETVLDFVRERGGLVGLTQIYQFGPNAVRSAAAARRIMVILEDHRFVEHIEGGAEIDGHRVKEAWRIRV